MSKQKYAKDWSKLVSKLIDRPLPRIQKLLENKQTPYMDAHVFNFANKLLKEARELLIEEQQNNQRVRAQWLVDKIIKTLQKAGKKFRDRFMPYISKMKKHQRG